jgi:hemoglobin-like flavoprotein
MTSTEIALLRSSFAKIAPIADQAAGLFYARLFELDPALRELFQSNMTEQGRKLIALLGRAVRDIDRPDRLAPAIRELGMRHASYRVKDVHFETVGAALLWTLEKGLGSDFTTETRDAWGKTYWLLAETMKAGVRDATAMQNRAVA